VEIEDRFLGEAHVEVTQGAARVHYQDRRGRHLH
jgi:hypothetical protein